jgi:hypothetical protein
MATKKKASKSAAKKATSSKIPANKSAAKKQATKKSATQKAATPKSTPSAKNAVKKVGKKTAMKVAGRKASLPREQRFPISLKDGYLHIDDIEVIDSRIIILYFDASLKGATFQPKGALKPFRWVIEPRQYNFGGVKIPAPYTELSVMDHHLEIDVPWAYRLAVKGPDGKTITTPPALGPKPGPIIDKDPIIINK